MGVLVRVFRVVRGPLNSHAIKSSFLLSFLESVPEVSARLKKTNTKVARCDIQLLRLGSRLRN